MGCAESLWKQRECHDCSLGQASSSPNVVVATPQGRLLIVGEAPGTDENKQGEGFVGDAGKALHKMLSEVGGLSRETYGVANICRCQPPKNRKPLRAEINSCLRFLADLIEQTQPVAILAVGNRTAVQVLCGRGTLEQHINSRVEAQNWSPSMGRPHPGLLKALEKVRYIVPMPHTSPRVMNNPKYQKMGKEQIEVVASLLSEFPPTPPA